MKVLQTLVFTMLALSFIACASANPFIARDHFALNPGIEGPSCTAPCTPILRAVGTIKIGRDIDPKIQLASMNEEFVKNFLPKVETPVQPTTLTLYVLIQPATEADVMQALGDRAETTMGQLYQLLQKQKPTEQGFIPTENATLVNITSMFIRDAGGKMAEISPDFRLSYGWSLKAIYLDEKVGVADYGVVSPVEQAQIRLEPDPEYFSYYFIAQ
jgi:hypothetical protein